MTATDNMRTAAEVLVDQLIVNGVRHAFCVPGESYLAVLDAIDNDLIDQRFGGGALIGFPTHVRLKSCRRSVSVGAGCSELVSA